jgi:hypothetical protein
MVTSSTIAETNSEVSESVTGKGKATNRGPRRLSFENSPPKSLSDAIYDDGIPESYSPSVPTPGDSGE